MAWMAAEAALAKLGVRPQTLYAYVSRGRIAARPDPADPRRSLYDSGDVERLARRRVRGRREAAVAQEAIAWGAPILDSAISTIAGGRLIYRGADAVELAGSATLESIAALLWQAAPELFAVRTRATAAPVTASRRRALFETLARRAGEADPALGRAPAVLHAEGAAIVYDLALTLSGVEAELGEPVHAQIARGWGAGEVAADAIRRTLVLLADHELNASAFAARVTASTGASLAAAALSGLAALSGPLHGTANLAVMALAREAEREGPEAAVRAWLAQGRAVPGFGHQLYANGDPRAEALLGAFEPEPPYVALRQAVSALLGLEPNVDYVLAAMTHRFALPTAAPFYLFALARSVGWIAHALEQGREGRLIRPRARYVGLTPGLPG